MESLEWRILDRVSSRNFILGGKLTDHVAERPWRGEGRPCNYGISWGEVGSVWGGRGGEGGWSCWGEGELPLRPPPPPPPHPS